MTIENTHAFNITKEYIEPMIEKDVSVANIQWTIEGFEDAWGKYIALNSSENSPPEKEKFLRTVKFHFSYKPLPEFLMLLVKDINLKEPPNIYEKIYRWHRVYYKKVLFSKETDRTAPEVENE